MIGNTAKIHPTGFKVSIGFLLGLAISLACARLVLRVRRFKHLFVDDGFLIVAVIGLTLGTSLTYVDIPYLYTQVQVESGVEAPPPDFIQQLVKDQKTQYPATVFLQVAVFSVKFSYLFLFRSLIRRLHRLTVWWWCVCAVLLPAAGFCVFTEFVSCPVFGASVIEACVTPSALYRENVALKLSTTLDILTDVMLISIPVLLLWRVQIRLRKKLALGSLLCLSIFLIIISIIKVSAGDFINGQIDTTWAVFWLQAEASVAVIVSSITIFRSLFVADETKPSKEPKPSQATSNDTWRTSQLYKYFPAVPSPMWTGTKTSIRKSSWTERASVRRSGGSVDLVLPLEGSGIVVTHDISLQHVQLPEKDRTSAESFV